MKIFIAYDFNDNPISVLLSDSIEKAHIAWAGMADVPHRVETIDPQTVDGGVYGLAFLLTSTEYDTRDLAYRSDGHTFRKFKRGL